MLPLMNSDIKVDIMYVTVPLRGPAYEMVVNLLKDAMVQADHRPNGALDELHLMPVIRLQHSSQIGRLLLMKGLPPSWGLLQLLR